MKKNHRLEFLKDLRDVFKKWSVSVNYEGGSFNFIPWFIDVIKIKPAYGADHITYCDIEYEIEQLKEVELKEGYVYEYTTSTDVKKFVVLQINDDQVKILWDSGNSAILNKPSFQKSLNNKKDLQVYRAV